VPVCSYRETPVQQFVPFEDEWEALERVDPSRLVPFRIGLPCQRAAGSQLTSSMPSFTSGVKGTDAGWRFATE
jgi:hypothetical protein